MSFFDRLESIPGVRRVVEAVRSSYSRKLATALFVVLLIVSAATVGLYVQLGALLGENVEQSMTAAANAEADELTEWTGRNRLVARVLSEHPVFETGADDAVRAYLQEQRATRQETTITNAYVIDRQNLTVETSADPDLEGTAVAALPWEEEFAFRNFDDVRITQPHLTENGTTVLGYITPIRDRPGHVLVVNVDAASVFERFEHPVSGGFTRVVDSNGTVVFANERSAALQQYQERTLRAPIVSAGLRGESGFVSDPSYERVNQDSDDLVAAYAPVAGTDWVVIEHAPAGQAFAITRQARTWIGFVGVLALVGLVGVVAVLGADVTGAVSRLSDRAEQIEDGEYDVSFETERSDEFGDLNRTLAATRDTLQRRIEEIRETRDELEASNAALAERSAMVSVLNRVLRHNVRNEVNIVAGRAELVADRVEDEALREQLEHVQAAARELAELSDRTQRIKQLLAEENAEPTSLSVATALEDSLDGVCPEESSVSVSTDGTGESALSATAVPTLPAAFADVVDQLVAHNSGQVDVEVSVEQAADADTVEGNGAAVVVALEDGGDGLPERDLRAVSEGEETPLSHAEGLALWCLEWTVAKSGGELVVDADGATLELRLPAADPAGDENEPQ